MAHKHNRPWLHVDLKETAAFRAAFAIVEWLAGHNIRVLNVAGPRASKDPAIYRDTRALLESVYYLSLSAKGPKPPAESDSPSPKPPTGADPPKRVRDVVERLLDDLPLKDRVLIANMSESELPALGRSLGEYVVNTYGLAAGNSALVRSCRWVGRRPLKDESEAAAVIIRALWKQLRRSHPLRRVK
jgi:hypothetical protein